MKNQKVKDKREFTRIPLEVRLEVRSGQTTLRAEKTRDLSMKGVFLYCRPTLPVGTDCEVVLLLGDPENPVPIELKGTVRRTTDTGMAVEFSEMQLESFEHIKNLVLYNTGEIGKVEEELKGHVGLKRKK